MGNVREISSDGLDLIKSFEGIPDGDPSTVNLDAYLDPIGIWTIGWGHAIFVGNQPLRGAENRRTARALYPNGLTLQECEMLLRSDLHDTCRDVEQMVKVALTDNQFGALVSFAFNLGSGNLRQSTLLRLLNQGDYAGAADEFQKWNKAGGKAMAGLTRRRLAEAALFRKA
jgi:lysozyme